MFLILTVLYNKTIKTSETLQGVLESAGLLNKIGAKVLLWDNSLIKMHKADTITIENALSNFEYVHTPENLALSEIYNKTISKGLIDRHFKYLILLDDDSKINSAYFEKAATAAAGKYPLIIPVVKNNGVIRSPMRSYIIKACILPSIQTGVYPAKNLMAINSGMIISFDFLLSSRFKYDDRLVNYATDSYFMKFYAFLNKSLYILDYTFDHSLSFFDSNDIKRKLEVFKQSKESYLFIHSDTRINQIMALTYNFISSLKNAVKYRNVNFLK